MIVISNEQQREYDELLDSLQWAQENLGEVQCQYGSEVSLYGDAWPGARIDIERISSGVRDLERRLENCYACRAEQIINALPIDRGDADVIADLNSDLPF